MIFLALLAYVHFLLYLRTSALAFYTTQIILKKANSPVATAAHAAHTQFARNTNKKIGFALLYCLYPYYREQAPIAG